MNSDVDNIIGFDKGIPEGTQTRPIYVTYNDHAQSAAGVQELLGKDICGVHMPCSADYLNFWRHTQNQIHIHSDLVNDLSTTYHGVVYN